MTLNQRRTFLVAFDGVLVASSRGDRGWLSHGLVVTLPISYSLDGGTLWGETLAADRIILLLQVNITFRMTYVIFVYIVAYDVAMVLF